MALANSEYYTYLGSKGGKSAQHLSRGVTHGRDHRQHVMAAWEMSVREGDARRKQGAKKGRDKLAVFERKKGR